MNKLLATTVAALFILGSTAALAEYSIPVKKLEPVSAQEILNIMACKDKKPGEQVKDQTDGKMVKCHEPKKTGRDLGS